MEQRSLDVRLRCIPFRTADLLFAVRDGVIWTFRTADPCFLYGVAVASVRYTVAPPRIGKSRFLYGMRVWACKPDRPGRKTAAQGFLRASTGNR